LQDFQNNYENLGPVQFIEVNDDEDLISEGLKFLAQKNYKDVSVFAKSLDHSHFLNLQIRIIYYHTGQKTYLVEKNFYKWLTAGTAILLKSIGLAILNIQGAGIDSKDEILNQERIIETTDEGILSISSDKPFLITEQI